MSGYSMTKASYGDDNEGGYKVSDDAEGRTWKGYSTTDGDDTYGQRKSSGYGDDTTAEEAAYKKSSGGYGEGVEEVTTGYGSQKEESGYGTKKTSGYGSKKTDDEEEESGYGRKETSEYGSKKNDNEEEEASGYVDGRRKSSDGYGSSTKKLDSDGDGVPDEFEKSQFNREDVEDLKNRTDIDDEERAHRRKVLMGEVAAGVVGAGVLGVAGYAAYKHFNKKDDEEELEATAGQEVQGEETRKSSFFGRNKNDDHDGDESSGYVKKKTSYGQDEDDDQSSAYGKKKTSYGDESSGYGSKKKTSSGDQVEDDESSGYGRKTSSGYGDEGGEEGEKEKKSWF